MLLKNTVKKLMPDPDKIKKNPHLKIFGTLLHNPNLWHLNRHSVAAACSIGLFAGYLPFPGHMITAAFLAIFFHANLPIAVALVWISNPFTIPPMFYFAYKLGAKMLNIPFQHFHFEHSFKWLSEEFHTVGIPLVIGSLTCGLVLAVLSNLLIRLIWRVSITRAWLQRKKKRSVL